MQGAPRSEQFDDIYFSAEDGLAETEHVFINGNDLPQAWENQNNFVIAETGFGTGLNFLVAWDLFEKTANPNQTLDFISFEKYPLSPEEIREYLKPWTSKFGQKIDLMCDDYPIRVRGFHRIKINPRITLTLIFDDVNEALPQLDAQVDAWFLDGFTPSKNPEMWTQNVFDQMTRLSHSKTTLATFTAAGFVREGLLRAGFDIQKRDGFGRKRDMITGRFTQNIEKRNINSIHGKSVAIIGGGLAGTACAYALKQYGLVPKIYEASDILASGASGNECGFYNPRFTTFWDAPAQFFASSYAQFISTIRKAGDAVNYDPCGALHLINTPEKAKRFPQMIENWSWHHDHAQIVSAQKASDIAGTAIEEDCLYLPDAGSVSPKKLCLYYAEGIDIQYNTTVSFLDELKEDFIVIANASAAKNLTGYDHLQLSTVRGQITKIAANDVSKNIKANIHFGGYLSRNKNGQHHIGASFQPWLDDKSLRNEDDQDNISKIQNALSDLKNSNFEITGSWAGLRTTTKHKFPVISPVHPENRHFITAAFGSHGLVGTIKAAHLLADLIREGPKCLEIETIKSLHYQRVKG